MEFLYIPPHPQKSPEYPEDIFYVKSVLDAFVLILTGDDEMKAQSHTICERKSGSSTSHPSQFTTAIDRGKHPVEWGSWNSSVLSCDCCPNPLPKGKMLWGRRQKHLTTFILLATSKMNCRWVISELTLNHAASISYKHKSWWFTATHFHHKGEPWLCSKTSLLQTPADGAAPIWDTAGLGAEGREKTAEPHSDSVLLLRSTTHVANFVHQSTSRDWVWPQWGAKV